MKHPLQHELDKNVTMSESSKQTAQSVKTQISLITYEELNCWVEHGLEWRKVCGETTNNCSTDHATYCSVCRKQLLHDRSSLHEKVTADAGQ